MLIYLYFVLFILISLLPLLLNIAFFTLAERKLMASIQRRRGPNVVGLFGLFQPLSDGIKILLKEIITPYRSHKIIFYLAPILMFSLTLTNWSLLSFSYGDNYLIFELSLLLIFAISSFNIYSIILSGWASNSRYPFIGAIRTVSQMISYEVSITVIFFSIAFITQSFNLQKIYYMQSSICWYILFLFPFFIIFLISILAETNRAPFDLPEAEAEIVAGYNLEYSSMLFAFFFLGEYGNILFMSALTTLIFLGGGSLFIFQNEILFFSDFLTESVFSCKTLIIVNFFILVRATFPRLRYDQLMTLGWNIFIPFTLVYFFFIFSLFVSFGSGFVIPILTM
jgi:NADH-quinone oxidoreductase subunit H